MSDSPLELLQAGRHDDLLDRMADPRQREQLLREAGEQAARGREAGTPHESAGRAEAAVDEAVAAAFDDLTLRAQPARLLAGWLTGAALAGAAAAVLVMLLIQAPQPPPAGEGSFLQATREQLLTGPGAADAAQLEAVIDEAERYSTMGAVSPAADKLRALIVLYAPTHEQLEELRQLLRQQQPPERGP